MLWGIGMFHCENCPLNKHNNVIMLHWRDYPLTKYNGIVIMFGEYGEIGFQNTEPNHFCGFNWFRLPIVVAEGGFIGEMWNRVVGHTSTDKILSTNKMLTSLMSTDIMSTYKMLTNLMSADNISVAILSVDIMSTYREIGVPARLVPKRFQMGFRGSKNLLGSCAVGVTAGNWNPVPLNPVDCNILAIRIVSRRQPARLVTISVVVIQSLSCAL